MLPSGVHEMITSQRESFVDFALMKEITRAEDAGVIHLDIPLSNEYEEPYLSELKRRMKPLDEVETYVVVHTLVNYHRKLLVKILEYMNKEGEKDETN